MPHPVDNVADKGFIGRPRALRAFQLYFPMHTLPLPPSCSNINNNVCGTGSLYRKFTWGRVDFFVLDLRMQRSDIPGATATMLGASHLARFKSDLLAAASNHWKVVVSSLPFYFDPKSGAGAWGMFSSERQDLVSYINTNAIKNVVFVSGDLHSGGAIDFGQKLTPTDPPGFPEISTPHTNISGNSPFELYDTGCGDAGNWKRDSASDPNNYSSGAPTGAVGGCTGFGYVSGGPGFVLLRIGGTFNQLTMEVRDSSGNVRTGSNSVLLQKTLTLAP
jgi:hypothetical protein